jgi:hypothetical protein
MHTAARVRCANETRYMASLIGRGFSDGDGRAPPGGKKDIYVFQRRICVSCVSSRQGHLDREEKQESGVKISLSPTESSNAVFSPTPNPTTTQLSPSRTVQSTPRGQVDCRLDRRNDEHWRWGYVLGRSGPAVV